MTTSPLDGLTRRIASRPIKGVSVPAIIHNRSYFLTDLGVYEDGIVECWGGIDLEMFRRKLASGWVTASIPDGETLSAHHLAHMVVTEARWEMTPESLLERVEAIVTALNPERRNLFDFAGDDTDRSGKVGVMKVHRGGAAAYRADTSLPFLERRIEGRMQKAFWRLDDRVAVVDVMLFDDDQVQITGAGDPIMTTLGDLRGDSPLTEAKAGDVIGIAGLVSFNAAKVEFAVPAGDLLDEMEIGRDRAKGRETPLTRTVAAFKAYKDDPTRAALEVLREAYESVPRHMRRYCGDMDVKDIPIRIALYGEGEIEGWSHHAVAKARGEPLPTIRVPKPKD